MKDKKTAIKKGVFAAFICAEAAIFITFNILSAVLPEDQVYLKYSGVLLCLAVCAGMIYFYRLDGITVACALAFTAVSDYFILVIDKYFEVGVTTFFIAQCIYFFRLYKNRAGERVCAGKAKIRTVYISLAARALVAAATLLALGLTVKMSYLLIACTFYFVMLVGNCVDAFIICRGGWKNALFAAGLLLFVLCDVCVGLDNFGAVLDVPLPAALIAVVSKAIWICYLPSQVLIVCSLTESGLHARKRDFIPSDKGSGEDIVAE